MNEVIKLKRLKQIIDKIKLFILVFASLLPYNAYGANENTIRLVAQEMRTANPSRGLFAEGAGAANNLQDRLHYVFDIQTKLNLNAQEVVESLYQLLNMEAPPNDYDILEFLRPVQQQAQVPVQQQAQVQNGLDDKAMLGESTHTQTAAFVAVLDSLDKEQANEAITNLKKQSVEMQESISHTLSAVSAVVVDRIDVATDIQPMFGVSAGDSYKQIEKGLWISGLYGRSAKVGFSSAYKGQFSGGSIGFDLNPTDTSLIGIAYSNVYSRFNYKTSKNKINAASNSVTIYAQQTLDKLVFRGLFSYIRSKISTKINKGAYGANLAVARAKFNNHAVSGELSARYKVNNNLGLLIMPNIGLRLSHFQDDSHKETGAGVLNLDIRKASSQKIAGIAGVQVMGSRALESGLVITPSLSVSMEKYINSKKPKAQAKLQWMDNYFDSQLSKAVSIGWHIGIGLAAKHNNLELSTNYNCHIENKYQSHQGVLKLRVLF